jgi:hypothetical protein
VTSIREDEARRLEAIIRASPLLAAILGRWADIALPDCWLVAGALALTVWNNVFGLAVTHGISDIDLVYFMPEDLSAAAETSHSARVRDIFSDLPVWIDIKNQARVHLWYAAKFGYPIRSYVSTADAITTFPTTATAVGVQPGSEGRLAVFASYGLADLLGQVVRPNKKQITQAIYEAKVARWIGVWPALKVVSWDADVPHEAGVSV